MESNSKNEAGEIKPVARKSTPDVVLFLYQPQGIEDSVTAAKLVAWEEIDASTASGRKIVTKTITRGVNLVSYKDFLAINADPECGKLFRHRSLVRICDGDNPFASRSEDTGVYGEIDNDAVIERTFRRDLLESWENWLKQQNWERDKSQDYGRYLQKVRDRIAEIDKLGKNDAPSYNPDYPQSASGDNRLRVV